MGIFITSHARASVPVVNVNAHVGSYNLILQNDLKTNAEIEGNAFIGGNISSNNTIVFGKALTSDSKVDAVSVVGNITPQITIENGNNVVYGGTNNGFNLNGGGSATQQDLSAKFNAIYDQVIADSITFAGLEATGSFDGSDKNKMLFTANETSGLNVINVNASDLSNGGEFSFSTTPNVPVVINVIGTGDLVINAKAGSKEAGFQGDDLASMVLWNFNGASSINFNGDGWVGSILAPYADVTGSSGHIEGALAAKSYTNGVELHNSLFAYTPSTPKDGDIVEVPTPNGIAMLAFGLILLFGRRLVN